MVSNGDSCIFLGFCWHFWAHFDQSCSWESRFVIQWRNCNASYPQLRSSTIVLRKFNGQWNTYWGVTERASSLVLRLFLTFLEHKLKQIWHEGAGCGGVNAIHSQNIFDWNLRKGLRWPRRHLMTQVVKKIANLWFSGHFWHFQGISCDNLGMNGQDMEVPMPSK